MTISKNSRLPRYKKIKKNKKNNKKTLQKYNDNDNIITTLGKYQ